MRHVEDLLYVISRKSFARLMHVQFTPCVPGDNKNDIIAFGRMQTEKRKCWFCVTLEEYVTPKMCLHSQAIHTIIMIVMISMLSKQ